MSEKHKVVDSTVPTFITIIIVDWEDLFVRPIYFELLHPGKRIKCTCICIYDQSYSFNSDCI